MIARRRTALLLGSAGLHGAAFALLALLATRAGLPPVLLLDLSAWEAATVSRPREAPTAPAARVGARAPVIETAAPSPARPLAAESGGGSAVQSAVPERSAAARQPRSSPEVGAETPAIAPVGEQSVRSGAAPVPAARRDDAGVTGPGALRGAAGGKGEGEGDGEATGAGRAASGGQPGGHGGGGGLGLSGGSRLALATPGEGSGIPAEYGPYLARFRQHVQDALIYPMAARRRGLAGRVELDVLIDPVGRVQRVEVAASSSHALLDEAAVDTVRGMDPLPLPEALPRRPLRVKLPLVFELR